MPKATQSQTNKQSQNVKVVVNNEISCSQHRVHRRSKPKRHALPSESIASPPTNYMPANPQSVGIAAYAPRPATYAPSTVQIVPDNPVMGATGFPSQLTNQMQTHEMLNQATQSLQQELIAQQTARAQFEQHLNNIIASRAQQERELGIGDPLPSPVHHFENPTYEDLTPPPPASGLPTPHLESTGAGSSSGAGPSGVTPMGHVESLVRKLEFKGEDEPYDLTGNYAKWRDANPADKKYIRSEIKNLAIKHGWTAPTRGVQIHAFHDFIKDKLHNSPPA
jgi:hypothetical protein